MSSKKTPATTNKDLPTLRIGSRVRCTDDHVEGRIVWANGVSVKIQWHDGEQVTWRRDSLAGRPIEILDADGLSDEPAQTDPPRAAPTEEPTTPTEPPTQDSGVEDVKDGPSLKPTTPAELPTS